MNIIAADCVAQRHSLGGDGSHPYRPCPNYCACWCHDERVQQAVNDAIKATKKGRRA